MLRRICVLLLAIAVTTATAQTAAGEATSCRNLLPASQIQASGLTVAQARQVLILVLKHEKLLIKKPGFNIEHIDFVPGYINFHVTYDAPTAAATSVIGAFAISPRTGDVWEVNRCKRYDFPALQRVQSVIAQRTRKTFASEVTERNALGCSAPP